MKSSPLAPVAGLIVGIIFCALAPPLGFVIIVGGFVLGAAQRRAAQGNRRPTAFELEEAAEEIRFRANLRM